MKQLDPRAFWNNVQHMLIEQEITLTELCQRAELSYNTVSVQKARPNFPKLEQICAMADAFDVSLERLVFGADRVKHYSARVRAIADACEDGADPEDLFVIEKILGIKKTSEVYTVPEEAIG